MAESGLAAENALTALTYSLSRQMRFALLSQDKQLHGDRLTQIQAGIEIVNQVMDAILFKHWISLVRMRRLLPFIQSRVKDWESFDMARLLYEACQQALAAAVSLGEVVLSLVSQAVSSQPLQEGVGQLGDSMFQQLDELFRILEQKRKLLSILMADTGWQPDKAHQEEQGALLAAVKKLEGSPGYLSPAARDWLKKARERVEGIERQGISPRLEIRIIPPARSLVKPWLNDGVWGPRSLRQNRISRSNGVDE